MLTVAYLANQFPSPVEPYVGEEIGELRKRGVRVITGSVRNSRARARKGLSVEAADIILQGLSMVVLLQAAWLCLRRWKRIAGPVSRIIFHGREGPIRRGKALLHTWLGAAYAVMLEPMGVEHIHVHHGYFGSWIGMIAARLLGVGYSLTLHGSDLLLHGSYLDAKLDNCAFCLTVSDYNRRYILEHYPGADAGKIRVARLGVKLTERATRTSWLTETHGPRFALLAVGRLHAVKDQAFLVRACAELYQRGLDFECFIAGEGPERRRLESLIRKHGLEERVTLLGHVVAAQMDSLYLRADVVALTSHSEGLPLVLMEAMARGRVVLAPAITGIPELVVEGKTGFLYRAGSLDDFVARLLFIRSLHSPDLRDLRPRILSAARRLDWVRYAAWMQVRHNFDRRKNLESFGELFIRQIAAQAGCLPHENLVLQQIQLSVQRHRSLPV
jgi:colanic acid/amylovoran biosynthesis glycosyltransferase